MNVISIDGVEYVKAGVIAKQYKYTADYVGQLCRGRKVDAKLVGRTWYVNPLSLTSHKTARYAKEGLDEKTIENSSEVEVSRLDVEPVARKTAIKISGSIAGAPANFLKRVEWQPLKYETDEAELNPSLQHLDNPVNVEVDLADSMNLKISSATKKTILEADPLPEVPLRGTLNLSSLDIDFDLPEENIASSETLEVESEPETKKGTKVFLNKITAPVLKKETKKSSAVKEIKESEAVYNVEINEGRENGLDNDVDAIDRGGISEDARLRFTPARVKERSLAYRETEEEEIEQMLPLWPAVLLLVLGLGTLSALYFVEFSVVASAQNFVASWQINTALLWPF